MKKFLAQLRPMERRLAVAVLVALILALNWAFVWPRFADWGNLSRRMDAAKTRLAQYQAAIADTKKYQELVQGFEGQGQPVPPEDQAINFMRTVQTQAAASGISILNSSRSATRTNQFFSEQSQNINVMATDAQLVDFLYKLGEKASLVRVRDLDLQPDSAHQHLNAGIQLVATYQNKASAAEPASPKTDLKKATAKSK